MVNMLLNMAYLVILDESLKVQSFFVLLAIDFNE